MGRSFYPLDAGRVIEDFTVSNRLELPAGGLAYEMIARDGAWFMRQIVLGEDGSEFASYEREMLWVLGSGNHSRSYLTGENGYLYQMPVCWYPAKPGWDLCPGFEHNNLFFMREATGECLFCHNGRAPQVANTTNRFGEGMPHGIDCERCHGPGAAHVTLWKTPPEEIPDADATIVNPRRLDRERRVQTCLQCHLGDSAATERVWRAGRDPRDFHPGLDLDLWMDPIGFAEPAENLYGLTAQADRLVRSRCWTESGGAIECLTCHNPHVSIYTVADRQARFRAACLTCHEPGDCGEAMEARHAGGMADGCAACHMRRSEPADHPWSRFTDHWIRRRIDPPAPPVFRRESAALSPIFPAAHAEAGEAERLANMGRAAQRIRTLNPLGHLISWAEAERPLRRSLEIDPSRAGTWYTMAMVAAASGRTAEAIGSFREAVRRDPGHHAAHEELGTLLLEMGRAAEAIEVLERAVAIKPDEIRSLTGLGRALVVEGREEEGEALFRRAAATMPSHSTPHANLGLLALRRGLHEEAASHLMAAAAREPSKPEIWEALADALDGSGGGPAAASARRRAASLRAED